MTEDHAPPTRRSRVLVTGGAGRLGRYAVKALATRHDVVSADLADVTKPGQVHLDVTDLRAVRDVVTAKFDVIVHLAALDYDTHAEPDRFVSVNTLGTWNVLQASAEAGLRRVIACSSIAALGLHEMRQGWVPQSLPVDEDHDTRPAEAYSVSKLIIEEMAKSFVRLHSLDVMCLRPVAIVFPEELATFMRTVDPKLNTLFDYVGVDDVAQALVAAVERRWTGYQQLILSAADSAHDEPTLDWYEQAVGPLPDDVDRAWYAANPRASIFSSQRAKTILGWKPGSSFADLRNRYQALERDFR
jgi:nucleoside-diphosphate-sugar epimerase